MEEKKQAGLTDKERSKLHFWATFWSIYDRLFRLKLITVRWEIPFGKEPLRIAFSTWTPKPMFEFGELVEMVVRATTKELYNKHNVNIVTGFCYETQDYKVEITLKKPFIKPHKRVKDKADIYSKNGLTR